ncbi:Flp pilus assembly protein CpaB [Nocardioides guangzhouensis]|uniref:Flp pilus assembly protein CpaB n=1 Tax=Nocardioides guangzhouensis TaxID=2497878 RepID=A0A4Q4ZCG1_9ACTN|nr:Flp pilus assembly protein CpaB [Nocardioides guangzhouensis]RYP85673.1 Flp pilus assembly protein CpaB [Nocardioides guangzhouensis]
MGRRKFLLPVAALIAALGTLMVFLYAQNADGRAADEYDTVKVLTAVKQVEAGEKFNDAVTAGKFELQPVAKSSLIEGYQTDLSGLSGRVATQTIFTGEQVTTSNWGDQAVASTALAIPEDMMAISVNLTDPGRVSGFVTPGSDVAVYVTLNRVADQVPLAQLLLERVKVIGIGDTSTITSTKTTKDGEQTTEEVPQTLMTLAVNSADAQKVFYAVANGELSVGLLTNKTTVKKSPPTLEQNLFQ